jgi:hypothetical protein
VLPGLRNTARRGHFPQSTVILGKNEISHSAKKMTLINDQVRFAKQTTPELLRYPTT